MKHPLIAMGLLGILGTATVVGCVKPAHAANSNVEAALQSYGDLSMFYQALLNTGVINELDEDGHYTIFAPTNAAFAEIRPQTYPCFYAVQCRPQIAAILREHIILDNHPMADLTSYGYGIRTLGDHRIHVQQDFVNDYSVDGHKILSKTETSGNTIYRVSGVIATPQELSQFQSATYVPAAGYIPDDGTVTTEKTVTRKLHHHPTQAVVYPSGDMAAPDNSTGSQTTIVTHTYSNQ